MMMKTKTGRFAKILYLAFTLFLVVTPLVLEAGKKTARGIVFEDANRNGVFDKGENGIPNGYFRFTFTGNHFQYRFYPASPQPHSQMRINSPCGTLSPGDLKNREINVNVFTAYRLFRVPQKTNGNE
ncbi:MAG: hypothetical protein JSV88_04775 [Candidatus Aminicenantes bacterium]|nr:MAG: hypothetical protein JSV88_04775 [Candidatus Aminicenantes bacterium]